MIEHQTRGKRRSRAKDAADRKRAVYVEQACVTCKSRKTRCDGTHPCEPCRRRSLDCRYVRNPLDPNQQMDNSPGSLGSSASKSRYKIVVDAKRRLHTDVYAEISSS